MTRSTTHFSQMQTISSEINKVQIKVQSSKLANLTTSVCNTAIWIKEATYHTRERARALMTRALPRKDKEREHHDLRTWSPASIWGRQLLLSRSPTPTKTPRILIFEDDHSRATGGSVRPHQPPSQRPLDLA